jgi:hypothetical protein
MAATQNSSLIQSQHYLKLDHQLPEIKEKRKIYSNMRNLPKESSQMVSNRLGAEK